MHDKQDIERLTPRQRDVLELLAKGLTNEDIAGVLGIAFATVRNHVTAVLSILEVTNRTEATACYLSAQARVTQADALLARPAIAVLPLVALDDTPRAATIASAITRDLTNLFARSTWFPVIAQVSTAGVRALGLTSQALGERLGARFLVDGALRMTEHEWLLDVQIDDCTTGHMLWTARYAFPLEDLFAHELEICATVVAHAYPVLVRHVQARLRRESEVRDLAAWELTHHGMDLCATRDRHANGVAIGNFERALALDSTLTLAYFGRGLAAYDAVLNQWGDVAAERDALADAAERCMTLAPHVGEGYYLQARYFQTRGDHQRAVPMLELAVSHNPSLAQGYALLAQTLHLSGRSDEALERMRQAMRLGPRAFVAGLANLHWMRNEYAEALSAAEDAVVVAPRYTFARVLAAVSAHHLGQHQRAHEHLTRLRRDYPPFDSASFGRIFGDVDAVSQIGRTLALMD